MSLGKLAEPLNRLYQSLEKLEAAVQKRQRHDKANVSLSEALAAAQDDRARLASELDQSLGKLDALLQTKNQLTQKLTRANETIKSVLGKIQDIQSNDRA